MRGKFGYEDRSHPDDEDYPESRKESSKPLDVESVLGEILLAVLGGEKISEEDTAQMLSDLYAQNVGKFIPLVRAVSTLAKPVGKDLSVVLATFLVLFAEMTASPEYKKAFQQFLKMRAGNKMLALKAYTKAGFTRGEAFALMMQDPGLKTITSNISQLSSFVSKGKKDSE